jgi:hypothetical protein
MLISRPAWGLAAYAQNHVESEVDLARQTSMFCSCPYAVHVCNLATLLLEQMFRRGAIASQEHSDAMLSWLRHSSTSMSETQKSKISLLGKLFLIGGFLLGVGLYRHYAPVSWGNSQTHTFSLTRSLGGFIAGAIGYMIAAGLIKLVNQVLGKS